MLSERDPIEITDDVILLLRCSSLEIRSRELFQKLIKIPGVNLVPPQL